MSAVWNTRARDRKIGRKSIRWTMERIADGVRMSEEALTCDEDLEDEDKPEAPTPEHQLEWAAATAAAPAWMLARLQVPSWTADDTFVDESELLSGRWSPVGVTDWSW